MLNIKIPWWFKSTYVKKPSYKLMQIMNWIVGLAQGYQNVRNERASKGPPILNAFNLFEKVEIETLLDDWVLFICFN